MQTNRQPWTALRVLREKDGHTMTSLARTAGMSLGYLSDLENGRREPNPRVTLKLAQALNVPTSVLEKHRREASAA
jgi:transcriptional regulator with XRE-family HTH domain